MDDIKDISQKSKQCFLSLSGISIAEKNKALKTIADALDNNRNEIIEQNNKDIQKAEKQQLDKSLLKRLIYNNEKINSSISQINSIISLTNPCNQILEKRELDSSLLLKKVSCPIGVIGVIFESRPDALIQIASLCLKSSNTVLMKGGSEAYNTNTILADLIKKAVASINLIFSDFLYLIKSRQDVSEMLKHHNNIDLIIPRGSNSLVKHIMDNTKIPILGHADGICHIYVDKEADIQKSIPIIIDAKTQYPAVCNAVETLLIHKDIAKDIIPLIVEELNNKNVEIRTCNETIQYIPTNIKTKQVEEDDWETEYNDLIISIKIVSSTTYAITHINKYSSHHTDAILTENKNTAEQFMSSVDSASVFHNCSTRFADGYRYGLGAELGISTSKIHARGPVGLEGLTIYKWQLEGDGEIVADYASGKKQFNFKNIK